VVTTCFHRWRTVDAARTAPHYLDTSPVRYSIFYRAAGDHKDVWSDAAVHRNPAGVHVFDAAGNWLIALGAANIASTPVLERSDLKLEHPSVLVYVG
jgi:hypothetical protein